jgi:hypothetical protein
MQVYDDHFKHSKDGVPSWLVIKKKYTWNFSTRCQRGVRHVSKLRNLNITRSSEVNSLNEMYAYISEIQDVQKLHIM